MLMAPIPFYSFNLTTYDDTNLGFTLFTFQFMMISNDATGPRYVTGHLKLTSVCIPHISQPEKQQ